MVRRLPKLSPAMSLPTPQTEMTTMANGMVVASQETYGQVAAVGLFVRGGSMYELPTQFGVSHVLEQMAFKSCGDRTVG